MVAAFALVASTASMAPAGEGDEDVKGLWIAVYGLPANTVDVDFQMNDEGVASYTRLIDDGIVALVVERLPVENDEGELVTPENLAALVALFEDIEEDDIDISADLDGFAELYTYPVAGAEYQTGENEDTRDCVDLFIFTDSWLFRVHVVVAADFTDEYKEMVGEWLTHLELVER
ncbi:MAG: hypothetical protein GX181_05415 [Synergistaceae bacterium]|nr:hypothetical protein [Synergistota bacterium]NLM71379.1 hypothetical protein [Synergistaceae bacterium]